MSGVLIILILSALLISVLYLSMTHSPNLNTHDRIQQTADAIDKLLPQTQCGKCGYSGCKPYAEAIARGTVDINQCPPGGVVTMQAMARLLGRDARQPIIESSITNLLAVIDEDLCIGCVKCIKACPVDAIIGAPKKMHTVIKQNCTGCGLCVAPCPVDCISLRPVRIKTREWVWAKPDPALRLRG